MIKILFILPYYKIGGTLTSFRNLIPLINKDIYDVSAYALVNEVDDYTLLPKAVNYVGLTTINHSNKVHKIELKPLLIKLLKFVKLFLTKIGYDPSDILFKKMATPLSGKYDVVIAFQEGQATRMAHFVNAPKKIAWIHCIYSRYKNIVDVSAVSIYNYFDKIVCVSQTAAEDLIECEPQWKNKIHVVYNCINRSIVNRKANSKLFLPKKINLVSIGRIDPVKRFSYIPQIARRLNNLGFEFDWWIIGGVSIQEEYDELMLNINKFNVGNCVHPIGAQSNPYPYIKSSDILICLSSSETFNYTIAEAKIIGTPIITTDFPSAFEFVENKKTGLILPIENIADGISLLLTNKDLYQDICDNLVYSLKQEILTKQQFEILLS